MKKTKENLMQDIRNFVNKLIITKQNINNHNELIKINEKIEYYKDLHGYLGGLQTK